MVLSKKGDLFNGDDPGDKGMRGWGDISTKAKTCSHTLFQLQSVSCQSHFEQV